MILQVLAGVTGVVVPDELFLQDEKPAKSTAASMRRKITVFVFILNRFCFLVAKMELPGTSVLVQQQDI